MSREKRTHDHPYLAGRDFYAIFGYRWGGGGAKKFRSSDGTYIIKRNCFLSSFQGGGRGENIRSLWSIGPCEFGCICEANGRGEEGEDIEEGKLPDKPTSLWSVERG